MWLIGVGLLCAFLIIIQFVCYRTKTCCFSTGIRTQDVTSPQQMGLAVYPAQAGNKSEGGTGTIQLNVDYDPYPESEASVVVNEVVNLVDKPKEMSEEYNMSVSSFAGEEKGENWRRNEAGRILGGLKAQLGLGSTNALDSIRQGDKSNQNNNNDQEHNEGTEQDGPDMQTEHIIELETPPPHSHSLRAAEQNTVVEVSPPLPLRKGTKETIL